jgi:hypothetical protein
MAKYYDVLHSEIDLKKTYWIYIINKDGEPWYVGKAKGFRRVCQHYSSPSERHYRKINEAINQGSTVRSVIVFTTNSEEEVFDYEINKISELRKAGIALLNICNGGEGKGRVITTEHREKLAAALRGRKRPPEVVAKMSESAKGKKWTDQQRAKQSLAHRKPWTPERREKAMQRIGGKPPYQMTDEIRAKISSALKGKSLSEQTKIKISNAHKGKPKSPEHIEKVRQKRLGSKASPELKARLSEIHKHRWAKLKLQQIEEQKNES